MKKLVLASLVLLAASSHATAGPILDRLRARRAARAASPQVGVCVTYPPLRVTGFVQPGAPAPAPLRNVGRYLSVPTCANGQCPK